jgi:hypothetical protein
MVMAEFKSPLARGLAKAPSPTPQRDQATIRLPKPVTPVHAHHGSHPEPSSSSADERASNPATSHQRLHLQSFARQLATGSTPGGPTPKPIPASGGHQLRRPAVQQQQAAAGAPALAGTTNPLRPLTQQHRLGMQATPSHAQSKASQQQQQRLKDLLPPPSASLTEEMEALQLNLASSTYPSSSSKFASTLFSAAVIFTTVIDTNMPVDAWLSLHALWPPTAPHATHIASLLHLCCCPSWCAGKGASASSTLQEWAMLLPHTHRAPSTVQSGQATSAAAGAVNISVLVQQSHPPPIPSHPHCVIQMRDHILIQRHGCISCPLSHAHHPTSCAAPRTRLQGH